MLQNVLLLLMQLSQESKIEVDPRSITSKVFGRKVVYILAFFCNVWQFVEELCHEVDQLINVYGLTSLLNSESCLSHSCDVHIIIEQGWSYHVNFYLTL